MAHLGQTTEWEDIQVKMGNYMARDKEPTNDEIEKIAIDLLENYDPLAKKNLEQLNELADDDEDDEVLQMYQQKRLAEMKEFAMKPKFGKVTELRKQDYIPEVTNAPTDVWVVLHLYQTYSEASNVLALIFDHLAKKFPLVKFMRIVATNCIENFKDADVPGVLLYQNAKLIRQFIPATYFFGGKNLSWLSKFNLIFKNNFYNKVSRKEFFEIFFYLF
jgi:hypothetical protein